MPAWRLCSLRLKHAIFLLLILGAIFAGQPIAAGEVRVAVAANFAQTLKSIIPAFEAATGHRVLVSSGATGVLYAQITRGAPFDLFFAADRRRPAQLVHNNHAFAPVRPYAEGRLVVYPARDDQALQAKMVRRIALANPKTAPYGQAAMTVLQALAPHQVHKGVRGTNIAQAYQFVVTGAADLGFVALSQVKGGGKPYWVVPRDLYPPITQGAVRVRSTPASEAFWTYIFSPAVQDQLEEKGYGRGDG